MKKSLFMVAVLLLSTFGKSFAADDEITVTIDRANHFAVGVKAGGNISMPSGNKNGLGLELSSGIGYQAGVLFNYHFGRHSAVDEGGTGLFALQIEGTYTSNSLKSNISNNATYNHIDVGGVVQIFPHKNFYVEAGAVYSLCISSGDNLELKNTIEGDGYNISGMTIRPRFGDTVNPVLGVGYKYKHGLGVNLRYILGMDVNATDLYVKKVGSLQLSISYTFDLIK